MMASNRQLKAIRREAIAPCMTCPICKKLLREATTINECLHTFCRKCIYNKITKEDLRCCPECNVYLGCAPLEKLRADHSWEDLRAEIFSMVKKNSKESQGGCSSPSLAPVESNHWEEAFSFPLPHRRKERSLSSLVSPPKEPDRSIITGKRKYTRKVPAAKGLTLSIDEPTKKAEHNPENSCPPPAQSRIAQSRKQNFSAAKAKQHVPHKVAESPVEPLEGMADLWKPLNCLVEAAGMATPSKPTLLGSVGKSSAFHAYEGEQAIKTKYKEQDNKIHGNEVQPRAMPSSSVKPRKVYGDRQKKAATSEGRPNIASQAVANATRTTCCGRVNAIWFSLIASDAQEGDAPLPQITSSYLMVKNPCLPVSFIQKYLVQKLGLISEDEVEVMLHGQVVPPVLLLQQLMELWLQTMPRSERIRTTVGSSAKDFVMVLHYGRRTRPF